ncbi:hypothetical protein [Scytonema sp. NUACC26]|uniref:hypothetical protein n=1 Tax=Scytonema sp. NUACC26 TaxID=3140176 RepID=UPI0038B3F388
MGGSTTCDTKSVFIKLARLNAAGAVIRNIALNAAFLAADAGEPIQMKHMASATFSESLKSGSGLIDSTKGWV